MKITSVAFNQNEIIPKKYTCQGENVSPLLEISNPPANTKSFAIIMKDHDALNGDFAHWLIWNIDPSVREIREGTTPIGSSEGKNDFGKIGWGGPCPPSGTHRYEFRLYALNTMLELPVSSDKIILRGKIKGYVLEEASIVGIYSKT